MRDGWVDPVHDGARPGGSGLFDPPRLKLRLVKWAVGRAAVARMATIIALGLLSASVLLAACGEQKPETPSAILDIREGAAMVKISPDSEYFPAARGKSFSRAMWCGREPPPRSP